jgi:ferrous iron transport protein B
MNQATAAGLALDDASESQNLTIAFVGNPNSGKTTLFNALTGLRQKVGNYPGVTVEKKVGRASLPDGRAARFLDLPGLYSLTPHSPDELIAREVLLGLLPGEPIPQVVVNVVDASNLERNLYLTSQLLDAGVPVVIALTMVDMVRKEGRSIDTLALEEAIGVPVCAIVASKRVGVDDLMAAVASAIGKDEPRKRDWRFSPAVATEAFRLQQTIRTEAGLKPRVAFTEALTLLMQDAESQPPRYLPESCRVAAEESRVRLSEQGVDPASEIIEARYDWIAKVCEGALHRPVETRRRPFMTNERVDKIVMHPFWGYVLFFVVMAVVFQTIFTWAQFPMNWIQQGIDALGAGLTKVMPPGDLRDLLKEGVLGGVGNTIVFLPQILLLFLFVSLLEDTGYMARAAFLMDRLMSRVGLHGKSFIPLLSSFACAIPGIMATRTIGDRKARLITILVAPLMSCSARLPVYTLMIGAFIPGRKLLSIPLPGGRDLTLLSLPGATMLAMYLLGMFAAFAIAWLFHRTLFKGIPPVFLMELPPYRRPSLRAAITQMIERAGLFLKRAGTVILAISVVLWALSTYPKRTDLPEEQRIQHSFVGMAGRAIEPAIQPLGFDWKMGIGIVSSFAAREVFVTAMGTVYNVGDAEETGQVNLRDHLRNDVDPRTGRHVFTPLVAVSLMIYYVLAMQCMSTLAVVRRETNGWKWPAFQFGYMFVLAWGVTFAVFQVGRAVGWG